MTDQMTLGEALQDLETEGAAARPRPADADPKLTHLPIARISRRTAVFQPRTLEGNLEEDEAFIRDLWKALKNAPNKELDPITVWYGGRNFYVIDGHHRLLAYKKEWPDTPEKLIPVVEFKGTLAEAMAFAGRANHKCKLPMREDARLNFAWRLVCITDLLVRDVIASSGVSKRTVINMRNKIGELIAKDQPEDVVAYRRLRGGEAWWQVLRGEQKPDPTDWDEKLQRDAQKLAKQMLKALPPKQSYNKGEIIARALLILDHNMPKRLFGTEAWAAHHELIADLLNDTYGIEMNDSEEEDEDIRTKIRLTGKPEF